MATLPSGQMVTDASVRYLRIGDIGAYRIAFALSNDVWKIVMSWDHFAKDTVGKQWVRSVDSISANLAEGFGRYTKRDKINFYRYSFGSVHESLDWAEKAHQRNLLTSEQQYRNIIGTLQTLPREVNALIKYTNDRLAI